MPKQRQTCTRCSQRRQKCDRKAPCTRCVQNKESHLCMTRWMDGYNPILHRKYPRKTSPTVSWQSAASSGDTSSSLGPSPTDLAMVNQPNPSSHDDPLHPQTEISSSETPSWPTKLTDISIETLLEGKDSEVQQGLFNQSINYLCLKGTQRDANVAIAITNCYSSGAKAAELEYIQSILPPKEQMILIIDYYMRNMVYWNAGIIHGPSFRKELHNAYDSSPSDKLDLNGLDWRWTALLFSILSSSIIGSSEAVSVGWGFTIDDKVRLARVWGAATISCLNLGNYTAQYHISSVQAIYTMHAYEHLVGSTNQWIALRSVGVIIARGLGLHKLGPHPDDERLLELGLEQKQAFVDREIGRRVWHTLASLDWLCAISQSTYTVCIQKRQFTTSAPLHLDEETMTPYPSTDTPSFSLVGNYFFDYACKLLEYHNTMADAQDMDDITRYAKVLRFDGDMRATCAEKVPKVLNSRTPLNPNWPRWVSWARKLHQASVNHKIIMIHQSYLSKSFKDVRYTYSRWACASAAKTIINLYNVREPEEPQWWVEQAFLVTAGICLLLDLFHRVETDPETQEYLACVQKAIQFLQQFFTSSVALHGVRLLISLLQEYDKLHEGSRRTATTGLAIASEKPGACVTANVDHISLGDAARAAHPLLSGPEVLLSNHEAEAFNFDIDTLAFEDLMDYLPVEGGLDNNVFFDSIFSVGNAQSFGSF